MSIKYKVVEQINPLTGEKEYVPELVSNGVITTEDLIRDVQAETGLSHEKVEAAMNAYFKSLEEDLIKTGSFSLPGIGTFTRKRKKARVSSATSKKSQTVKIDKIVFEPSVDWELRMENATFERVEEGENN
ncbi:MAG: HU family DNA-binding protein [Bacteroidales bacterium]|nr:HU family DNA-binding protein [Bacteroidales bacterium]